MSGKFLPLRSLYRKDSSGDDQNSCQGFTSPFFFLSSSWTLIDKSITANQRCEYVEKLKCWCWLLVVGQDMNHNQVCDTLMSRLMLNFCSECWHHHGFPLGNGILRKDCVRITRCQARQFLLFMEGGNILFYVEITLNISSSNCNYCQRLSLFIRRFISTPGRENQNDVRFTETLTQDYGKLHLGIFALLSYMCIRYYLKAFNSARTAVSTVTESLFEDYAVSAFLELDKKVYCVGSIRSGRSVQWR